MVIGYLLLAYCAVGLLVAVPFVLFGLASALGQPVAATAGARMLFIPGAAALWPYVLMRWLGARTRP